MSNDRFNGGVWAGLGALVAVLALCGGCAGNKFDLSTLDSDTIAEALIQAVESDDQLANVKVSLGDAAELYSVYEKIKDDDRSAIAALAENQAIEDVVTTALAPLNAQVDGDAISWSMFKVLLNPDAWKQWLPLIGDFDIDTDWLPEGVVDIVTTDTSEPMSVFFLFDNAGMRPMNDLGRGISRDEFKASVQRQKDAGANGVWWFLSNVADGRGAPVSFYANNRIWGPTDEAAAAEIKWRCQHVRQKKMRIMFWMFADDSSANSKASVEIQAAFLQAAVKRYGDYSTDGYCIALEADEHMSKDRVQSLVKVLDGLTSKPIYVHQLSGRTSFVGLDGVDGVLYQYGWGKSPSQIGAITAEKIKQVAPKSFGAGEYNKSSDTQAAKAQGTAALEAGAIMTGNGRFE